VSEFSDITAASRKPAFFWRVLSFLALAISAGCAIKPSRVAPLAVSTDYSILGCAEIKAKSDEIAAEYRSLRGVRKHGIRLHYAHLNGHVWKINEANRLNGCRFPDLLIPGQFRPGTRTRV
jgi:hypothetical protein